MANLPEPPPEPDVRLLPAYLRDCIRVVNALQNIRVEIHKSPPTTGKLIVLTGHAVLVLE